VNRDPLGQSTVSLGTDGVAAPSPLPYSPSVTVPARSGLVFVSGQLPLDSSGRVSGSMDIGEQTRLALERALSVLMTNNCTVADIVKVTIYVTALGHYDAINDAYLSIMKDCRPARSMVEVSALPRGASVEVDLIAVSSNASQSATQEGGK